MNQFKIKIVLPLLLIFFSNFSYGEILIEPHIGYNVKGSADYNGSAMAIVSGQPITVPASFSDKYNGLQYGGRIGLQYTPGLMFGFDYNMSHYSIKETYTDGSPADTDSYKRSEIGAFLGLSLPLSIRVWYTYYIMKQTVTKTNTVSGLTAGDYNDGHSTEIGLGYTGFPYLSFNLLYRTMVYSDGDQNGVGFYTISPEYKAHEIVLGLSVPFTF